MIQLDMLFKIKDVFNPNDSLARWVLTMSIARNDFIYSHKKNLNLEEDSHYHRGERFYLFRLAISHYREIIKFIDFSKDDPKIKDFISRLDPKAQARYKDILDLCSKYDDPDSFMKKVILPIRNNVFHYEKDHFEKNLTNMKDFNTRFVSKGKKRRNLDLVYADEVSFEILFGYMSEAEFNAAVQTLSDYSSSFIGLVDVIVGEYFILKRHRLTKIVHNRLNE